MEPYFRRAWYHETDAMGIIHHANYIRWLEEARVDMMEKLGFGYGRAVETGIDFAVLEVQCAYKAMVRFGDAVLIRCAVTELGASRMAVSYRITDAATGELRATAKSGHCYWDGRKRRPVSLKKALPELYAIFEAHLEPDFDL